MAAAKALPWLSAPHRAELSLTNSCNLRCSYCHFFDSPNETAKELSTAEWLGAIDELGRMKVMFLALSGGEALLRDDLELIIEAVCRNRMRYSLLSNGYALGQEQAKMLAAHGHCDNVQISLDGIGEVNDAARGEGSFERAVNAIKLVQQNGIKVKVRITVGRHNLGTLFETVEFLSKNLGIRHIGANLATVFADKPEAAGKNVFLSLREQLDALLEAQRIKEYYPDRVSLFETAFAYAKVQWPYMIRALRDHAPPLQGGNCSHCHAPLEKIFIRADGAVTPCNHLPNRILGYVGETPIAELWANSPILTAMRERACVPGHSFPGCTDCRYAPYCRPTADCVGNREYASNYCLKKYQEAAPDFDFENLKWKNNVSP